MKTIRCTFGSERPEHALEMVFVKGTGGNPYPFGEAHNKIHVNVPDFFISRFPITQAFWEHLMGNNPACKKGDRRPQENISWNDITGSGGFLKKINQQPFQSEEPLPISARPIFRLPSETEWEYAARGGIHWTDGLAFSGSPDVNEVAWYQDNSGDQSHEVGQKAPNQLGLFDMCGNIWEWCQDTHTREVTKIPKDGRPWTGESPDRVLRGGCFHNWAIHCTVSKRYEIAANYHDGCIGFRLVLDVY